MTEIIAGSIGALGLVLVAILGTKINGSVRAVQGQVQNDHKTNLRDELDERHDETRRWFWALWQRQEKQGQRIAELVALVKSNSDRIEDIEDTFNPKEKK